MTACNSQNNQAISESVSDIQQKNIPDKRLIYWNVDVQTENGQTCITGATASETAFSELRDLANEKNIGFEVKLLPEGKFKENSWGVVTLSVCNIRSGKTHAAELATQALMGTPVKVYTQSGDWYLVQTPDRYFGWVDAAGVTLKTNAELAVWKAMDKVLYNKQNGFAYIEADTKSAVECDLVLTDLLSISGVKKDFYKILMADGREAFVKKDECVALDVWKNKNLSIEKVMETAFNFKGVPYLWGGTSAKMLDCSGLTKSAYYHQGVILQRDASQQTFYGELVETESGYDKLQTGDLVFFGEKDTNTQKEQVTHVGLCMGNQEFIHASGKVRINSLDRNSEKYTEHYENGFVRARRIIGNVDEAGIEWVVDNAFYKEVLP
ncbi:C40 family peptidase [Draconibacterium aestuarii]